MEEINNTKPELADVLMTAVYFAAQELAEVLPQPGGNSVEIWKGYLLQKSLKHLDAMTEENRERWKREFLL